MRQYDVYEHPVASARRDRPYVVVLSSHLLPDLSQIIVAPLTSLRSRPMSGLDVAVVVRDEPLLLVTMDLASLAPQRLKRRVGSLLDHEYDIRRALDRLFTGF